MGEKSRREKLMVSGRTKIMKEPSDKPRRTKMINALVARQIDLNKPSNPRHRKAKSEAPMRSHTRSSSWLTAWMRPSPNANTTTTGHSKIKSETNSSLGLSPHNDNSP